ncbi:MAG: hypothetical protein HY054_12070 [Proteobacteria bacterium]|nr:hypothetical protein [Pseudomonadota bacterium]
MAEPLKATFFTLHHRDRAVLASATLMLAAITLLLGAVFAGINWGTLSHLGDIFTMSAAESKDPARVMPLLGGVFGLMGSMFLVLIVFYLALAAYEAACLRWMIRGEAPGLFGWRFDNDMWRVYGVYWCWVGVHYAVAMAMGVLIVPIMFATMPSFLMNAGGAPPDIFAMMRWQLSVQLPLTLLQYLPLIFVGVRFGPAAATTVARQRFSFLEAWTVTRGRFWELLGSFAVLWLIAGVAVALVMALATGPLLMRIWPVFAEMWRSPSEAHVQSYMHAIFSPQSLVLLGAGYAADFVVLLALMLMSYGVNARMAVVSSWRRSCLEAAGFGAADTGVLSQDRGGWARARRGGSRPSQRIYGHERVALLVADAADYQRAGGRVYGAAVNQGCCRDVWFLRQRGCHYLRPAAGDQAVQDHRHVRARACPLPAA